MCYTGHQFCLILTQRITQVQNAIHFKMFINGCKCLKTILNKMIIRCLWSYGLYIVVIAYLKRQCE